MRLCRILTAMAVLFLVACKSTPPPTPQGNQPPPVQYEQGPQAPGMGPRAFTPGVPVSAIQHNPFTTTTNSPNVTVAVQQPVTITTTNQIALEAQGLISWTNLVNGHINVRSSPFLAKGDGISDDTAAIKAAYNLVATVGGTLFFPYTGHAYLCNILVTNSNISLVSTLTSPGDTNQITLRPFDLTKPTVQVGNDSGIVEGFSAKNISIAGCSTDGTLGAGAIHLLGGAVRASVANCGFIGGTNVVKFSAGATYPCTLNHFVNCTTWVNAHTDGETALYVFRPLVGSFTTAIDWANGYINGPLVCDNGQALNLANTYCDFFPNEGVVIRNGAEIRGDNVFYDNRAYTNVITIDWGATPVPDYILPRYLTGNFNAYGQVRWVGGAIDTNIPISSLTPGSVSPPYYGLHEADQYSLHYKPYFIGDLYLGGLLDGNWNTDYRIGANGGQDVPNAAFYVYRESGKDIYMRLEGTNVSLVQMSPGTNHNVSAEMLFDFDPGNTNANTDIRFFRSTSTTGTKTLTVFKGDGTATYTFQISPATGNTEVRGKFSLFGPMYSTDTGLSLNIGNGTDSTGVFDTDFISLTNADARVRFFRATSTTGTPIVQFMKGDGTTTDTIDLLPRTGEIQTIGKVTASSFATTNGVFAVGTDGAINGPQKFNNLSASQPVITDGTKSLVSIYGHTFTNDILVAGGTTNRMIFNMGICITNIVGIYAP